MQTEIIKALAGAVSTLSTLRRLKVELGVQDKDLLVYITQQTAEGNYTAREASDMIEVWYNT